MVSLPDRVTLPARATLPSRNTNPPTASIAQPVQSVSRPRIPRPQPATAKPPFSKISPDGDYLYEYVYEYEDDFDSTPKLVDSIDEYDLNPLTSKVIIKIVFRGSLFIGGRFSRVLFYRERKYMRAPLVIICINLFMNMRMISIQRQN